MLTSVYSIVAAWPLMHCPIIKHGNIVQPPDLKINMPHAIRHCNQCANEMLQCQVMLQHLMQMAHEWRYQGCNAGHKLLQLSFAKLGERARQTSITHVFRLATDKRASAPRPLMKWITINNIEGTDVRILKGCAAAFEMHYPSGWGA